MKINRHLSLLLIVSTVFFSCRKVIEPKDLPQQDPRMVLNAILTSSYTMGANISLSKSIVSGKEYKYVNNAVCDVYEDGTYLQTLKFISNGDYAASVAPKPNKKYTFKVAATGYDAISAETTVPTDLQVSAIEQYDMSNSYYLRRNYSGSGETNVSGTTKFRFTIIDDPSTDNYYSVTAMAILLDSMGQSTSYTVSPNLSSYNNSGLLSTQNVYGSTIDLDDKNIINGKEIQLNIGVNLFVNELQNKTPIKTIQIFLVLHNINADYYRYRQTVIKQRSSGISLFAEPVQLYSNVSNGMGILAGANTTSTLVYSGDVKDE